ncbi:hypothetical protein ABTM67_19900, partial [Acinetobacter baumannii]
VRGREPQRVHRGGGEQAAAGPQPGRAQAAAQDQQVPEVHRIQQGHQLGSPGRRVRQAEDRPLLAVPTRLTTPPGRGNARATTPRR